MEDFNKPATEIRNVLIIVTVISILIGAVVIFIFATNVANPIKSVTKRMGILSSGDLTHEPLQIKSHDEVGQLAKAMNDMHEWLIEIATNVKNAAEMVTNQSDELTIFANEVKEGAEQMATTMQELASGAESQAHHASELASGMETFAVNIQQVNEASEKVEHDSGEVLNLANDGIEMMEISTNQMMKIDQIVHHSVEKMEALNGQFGEISKLVSIIKDVAEQTNLLALNAAIEVARAGEQGRGFAVVADEVRKLAEEVAKSVSEITGFVNEIQTSSNNVADSLKDGYQEVENGTNQIMKTSDTLKEINRSITHMAKSIRSVSNNLNDIANSSVKMNSAIQEIASVSEESSAGIEEASAASEETSSAMDEVAHRSSQLVELVEQLNELLKRFKV